MLKPSLKTVLFCLFIFSRAVFASGGEQSAIASAHPLATQAGFEILEQGGNAFDAAIAVTAALAVLEPAGSGIGGGGFWLIHRAEDKFETMIDGRETAPGNAHQDMYLDANGKVNKYLSLDGPLAAAIPGVPAAIDHLAEHYGILPLSTSLAPAIRYAREGFKVSKHFQRLSQFRIQALTDSPEAAKTFLDNGQVPELDSLIIQPNLANTLAHIAKSGRDGFYKGEVAEKLVAGVQQAGGIWTKQDLLDYQVKEREPIQFNYQGYQITSVAPPSSGGILLAAMLNQLEQLPYTTQNITGQRHLLTEVMRRSYFDRSRYLGDSDFVAVPTQRLIDKSYAKQLVSDIDLTKASSSQILSEVETKGEDTTHFSIIDQQGNRVAATLSINYPFGSGFVPEGTGVLLNDEMDDFSAQVGAANAYGLVGNKANAIEANKRPLSSMTPTFVDNEEKLMVIGTPGGSRIITMVLLGILDFVDGEDAVTIVSKPRLHHQYLPDAIQLETPGFSNDDINKLTQYGHQIKKLNRQYGNMQIVIKNKQTNKLSAASDPRGEGLSLVK